jgi:hypothetical protein
MSDKDDRPKKSWREIDAQRDRSGGGRAPRREEGARGPLSGRSSKSYRSALDALFEKGGVDKLAEKLGRPSTEAAKRPPEAAPSAESEGRLALRKKILDAIDRDEISRAVDRYCKEHGLPEDFEVLEQALEHRKPERVVETLALLEKLLDRGDRPKRSRALLGKLRFLEETSYDDDIKSAAARVRAKVDAPPR